MTLSNATAAAYSPAYAEAARLAATWQARAAEAAAARIAARQLEDATATAAAHVAARLHRQEAATARQEAARLYNEAEARREAAAGHRQEAAYLRRLRSSRRPACVACLTAAANTEEAAAATLRQEAARLQEAAATWADAAEDATAAARLLPIISPTEAEATAALLDVLPQVRALESHALSLVRAAKRAALLEDRPRQGLALARRKKAVPASYVLAEARAYHRHGHRYITAEQIAEALAARPALASVPAAQIHRAAATLWEAAGVPQSWPLALTQPAAKRAARLDAAYLQDMSEALYQWVKRASWKGLTEDEVSEGFAALLDKLATGYIIGKLCKCTTAEEAEALLYATVYRGGVSHRRKQTAGTGRRLSLDVPTEEGRASTLLDTLQDDTAAATFSGVLTRLTLAEFLAGLTERQGRLVRLLAAGHSTEEAAALLGVSVATATRERRALQTLAEAAELHS